MTGDRYLHFWAGKILGILLFGTRFMDPLRSGLKQLAADLLSGGGVLTTDPTVTVAASKFTFTADRTAYTPRGARVSIVNATAPWNLVPFEDSGATVYTIGAQTNDAPKAAEVGIDGSYNWKDYEECTGRTTNPDSVASDGSGGLILTMTAALFTGEKWTLGAGTTRPVRVWFQTATGVPVTDSTQAIFTGTLSDNGTNYRILIPHLFGNAAANTTAARYTVLIEGPEPAAPVRAATSGFTNNNVILGTITSGTYSAASVFTIGSITALEAAFTAQHNPANGDHTDITADSAIVTDGVQTDPVLSGLAGNRYVSNVGFSTDHSPYKGNWTTTTGLTYIPGTPPAVSPANTLATVIRRGLDFLHNTDIGASANTLYKIDSIGYRYIRANVGDAITVALWRARRDGTGADTAVATSTPAVQAAFTLATLTLNHTIDPAYYYWIEIAMDAALAAADVQVATLGIITEKEAIE